MPGTLPTSSQRHVDFCDVDEAYTALIDVLPTPGCTVADPFDGTSPRASESWPEGFQFFVVCLDLLLLLILIHLIILHLEALIAAETLILVELWESVLHLVWLLLLHHLPSVLLHLHLHLILHGLIAWHPHRRPLLLVHLWELLLLLETGEHFHAVRSLGLHHHFALEGLAVLLLLLLLILLIVVHN